MKNKYSDDIIINLIKLYCNNNSFLTWDEIARANQISETTIKKRMYKLMENGILPISLLTTIKKRTIKNIIHYNKNIPKNLLTSLIISKENYFREKELKIRQKLLRNELSYLKNILDSYDNYMTDDFPFTKEMIEQKIDKINQILYYINNMNI